jgi:hypothetical protein
MIPFPNTPKKKECFFWGSGEPNMGKINKKIIEK